MDLLKESEGFNAVSFIIRNHIVNENGNPIEFSRHKFLAQPYMDISPRIVVKKAGQVGFSTLAIIRAFHMANYLRANIIYTLPSKSIVKDFVTPKVDPLVENNPALKAMVGDVDSMGLKQIGDRFVYFRSSWDEASGIAISAHILISDELDRSNPKAIRTYRTRLDAAKMDRPDLGWEWQFSNPSLPGYGVDEKWEESDQKHWFIKCSRCNKQQYMSWPDSINLETATYICKFCSRDLSLEDRVNGHWLPKFLGRSTSGYWINQMMVPWHTAAKIIEDSKGDQQVFHNFTMGLPYQPKDMSVSRGDILSCLSPHANPRTNVAIGVDVGKIMHYVVGNKYGIFMIGTTDSWEDIEELRNRFDAYMVIDANPYPVVPKRLAEKYRGKVFVHYYVQDRKDIGIVRWGDGESYGVVQSDRTKIIDALVADITAKDILYNMTGEQLDEYVRHWGFMFRSVVETDKGIKTAAWLHPDGKPDHYAHAHVYQKIAMLKTLSHGEVITAPSPRKESDVRSHPTIVNGQSQALSLKSVTERINTPQPRGWKVN